MPEPTFASALAHRADREQQAGVAVRLGEVSDRGMIDLRGNPSDASFLAAAEAALGVALPLAPRTSASQGGIAVFWLSIDQWLVTVPRPGTGTLVGTLSERLAGMHASLVDMSDARAILRLEGEGAREVLMKGAAVDLTRPESRPGMVRRLRFAEIAALVHIVAENPDVLDLYVFRSYADFAWEWLLATANEPARIRLFGAQDMPSV
jgi:sarcosine oxidase subunit gamma